MSPSPIILSDVLNLEEGQIRSPDSSKVKNPFRTPMLVDEIRFVVRGLDAIGSGIGGYLVRAKMELGRNPLTNTFVPVSMFGKLLNPLEERDLSTESYTWRLPRPLFVPTNEIINLSLQLANEGLNAGSAVVRYCVVGRVLPEGAPMPAQIWVPWVSAFVGQSRASGSDYTERTRATDLVNPFDAELHVSRLMGRVYADGGELFQENASGDKAAALRYLKLRLTSPTGAITVRDPTPFANVFNLPTRSWTVNTTLQRKGFYSAVLDEEYSNVAAGVDYAALLSMIGTRKVDLL